MRARVLPSLLLLVTTLLVSPARADELALDELAPDIEGAAFFSPYDNLDGKLLAALDEAKPGSTVYMSYYSLSYAEYPKMFAKLKDRGVKVRLNLFEGVNLAPSYTIDDDLVAAGFDVELIPNLRSPDGFSSLHTKFTVINDELIVTGSANLSASASMANHEHVVIVRNKDFARTFIDEWKEERTAATAQRDAMSEADRAKVYDEDKLPESWTAAKAAALAKKLAKIDRQTENPHEVVRTYFSPDDRCDEVVKAELLKAKKSVKVSMYQLASGRLAGTLATLAKKKVEVTLICDAKQQASESSSFADGILAAEPKIRYVKAKNTLGNTSLQHQKYAVIDDEVVIGGSYNWTAMASKYNDENLIIVRSRKLAEVFNRDFAAQLREYDPSGKQLDPKIEGGTSKVLFCVEVPFDVPSNYVVVVFGSADELGANVASKGLTLRSGRAIAPRWVGAVDLPRGAKVKWRIALVKQNSIVGGLNGDTTGDAKPESNAGRPLVVAKDGVPTIVRAEWDGADPFDGN